MFTVVVTGSRSWTDVRYIRAAFDQLILRHGKDIRVINGTAPGADRLCAGIARQYELDVVDMPAEWNKYGRSAGFRRNIEMLDLDPDLVLAFWDGESRGTQHTISEARKRYIPTHVCTPQGWEKRQ